MIYLYNILILHQVKEELMQLIPLISQSHKPSCQSDKDSVNSSTGIVIPRISDRYKSSINSWWQYVSRKAEEDSIEGTISPLSQWEI